LDISNQEMKRQISENVEWTEIIEPRSSLFDWKLKEVWNYRDLLRMFVRRDFVATYKQTILGPLWFFIQPIFTTITFTIVFGNFAGISSDGQPRMVFYMAGLTLWNYFSECFTKASTVFTTNANIFGKVYFPRLIMPLTIVVSNLIKFAIQYMLFLVFYGYFLFNGNKSIEPNSLILLTPFLILLMAGISLGAGMIFSAMTTKYKDLTFLLTFGIQLLMYATPVIYPLASIPDQYKTYVLLNPLTAVIETFRYGYLGTGTFSWSALGYSSIFMVILLLSGITIFNKVERSFMDTV
jgi:lipopolysaccharide transport system permease protein